MNRDRLTLDAHDRCCAELELYGQLLTEKQNEVLSLYFQEDLSLSEIAEQYEISRQAVHDHLNRGIEQLERWESHLSLLEHKQILTRRLNSAITALDEGRTMDAKTLIQGIIDETTGSLN